MRAGGKCSSVIEMYGFKKLDGIYGVQFGHTKQPFLNAIRVL